MERHGDHGGGRRVMSDCRWVVVLSSGGAVLASDPRVSPHGVAAPKRPGTTGGVRTRQNADRPCDRAQEAPPNADQPPTGRLPGPWEADQPPIRGLWRGREGGSSALNGG